MCQAEDIYAEDVPACCVDESFQPPDHPLLACCMPAVPLGNPEALSWFPLVEVTSIKRLVRKAWCLPA